MADQATTPDPGIELPGAAPTDEIQIPASMLGMGGQGLDSFSSALRGKAEKILPDVMEAAKQSEKDKGDAALAEAKQLASNRQQMADIYKNYKPETVDFGGQPNQPEQNPIKQFGSMASMLGVFASAFTKKPIINALNASAAAMNAARAGDMEAYKNSYQAWQDHITNAVKKNELDHKFLDEKLEEAKDDNASALAEIKAYAVANDWPAASVLAQAGDLEGLARLAKSLEVAGTKTGNFKTFIAQQWIKEFIQKNGRPPNAEESIGKDHEIEGKGERPLTGSQKQKLVDSTLDIYSIQQDVDKLSALIEGDKGSTLNSTGYMGKVREAGEYLAPKLGITSLEKAAGITPGDDKAHQIGYLANQIKDRLPGVLSKIGYSGAFGEMTNLVGVRGAFTDPDEALQNLTQLRAMLQDQMDKKKESATAAGFDLDPILAQQGVKLPAATLGKAKPVEKLPNFGDIEEGLKYKGKSQDRDQARDPANWEPAQ